MVGEYCIIFVIKSISRGSYVLSVYTINRWYLLPRNWFYIWKLTTLIQVKIRIHLLNLIFLWSSKHLNNFYQLFKLILPNKWCFPINHLYNNTSSCPHINFTSIISSTKNKLWCSITSRTYICDIYFIIN